MSDYIPLTPKEMYISNSELWYTNGSTTEPSIPYRVDIFGANIESNSYDSEKECWILKFDGDVTLIGSKTFYNCNELTSITIPSNVISIGYRAFFQCENLEIVTLQSSSSLISIGKEAFYNCSGLTSIDLSKCTSLTSIGDKAFYYCESLTSITIPTSVIKIGSYAFLGCSLSSLTFEVGGTWCYGTEDEQQAMSGGTPYNIIAGEEAGEDYKFIFVSSGTPASAYWYKK